jgi:hypothetical protein
LHDVNFTGAAGWLSRERRGAHAHAAHTIAPVRAALRQR